MTRPLGSTLGFAGVDPLGNPVTVVNEMTNFGFEYVWHCHILSHEENDMMRPVSIAVRPEDPDTFTAVKNGQAVNLSWKDQSANETAFTIHARKMPRSRLNWHSGLSGEPRMG